MIIPAKFSQHRPKFWLVTAPVTLAAVGALTLLAAMWFGGPHAPRIVANNISRNFRACLISDSNGAAGALSAWAGMQQATHTAPINAQRIQTPTATTPTALPYINSLVQRHCGLIISAGTDLHDAVDTAAQHNPHQRFINIGPPIQQPNVQNLPTATPSLISDIVRSAAQGAHPQLH
jgi:basic membrane lipoprotein Med (substrate-binding protein (PBP1-ABC) superfamily)